MKDAYSLILTAIEGGTYRPGDRLVESELAERFGVSRTPVREALQRLETQAMLVRDGRSLIVASLDHNQLAELYTVRAELEALAARLAARHATPEEVRVLAQMVEDDQKAVRDPEALARANLSGAQIGWSRGGCKPMRTAYSDRRITAKPSSFSPTPCSRSGSGRGRSSAAGAVSNRTVVPGWGAKAQLGRAGMRTRRSCRT